MGFLGTTFTFMVGTLCGVYICQNYNIPNLRSFADSSLVRAKQIEQTYRKPRPIPKTKSEDNDVLQ
ncbi:hypothetical protein CFP56_034980 [Quercus suber]|uniref:Uncharacterized protein n=1 Tax=Quercus suber TaxID=58331 RepID=A0AAW0JAV9_QUESU